MMSAVMEASANFQLKVGPVLDSSLFFVFTVTPYSVKVL